MWVGYQMRRRSIFCRPGIQRAPSEYRYIDRARLRKKKVEPFSFSWLQYMFFVQCRAILCWFSVSCACVAHASLSTHLFLARLLRNLREGRQEGRRHQLHRLRPRRRRLYVLVDRLLCSHVFRSAGQELRGDVYPLPGGGEGGIRLIQIFYFEKNQNRLF